ncbi:MAG: AzlC family ABC transporter permease [Candidatus Protistobacter heckmanni]|nr:AzlC family ABC transporter permease [Candidatus Protistobacter heckmanni]
MSFFRSNPGYAAFKEGFLDGQASLSPYLLGIAAYGIATGVAMAKSALSLSQAILMSVSVYAGSAQLASLPLIGADAPTWAVALTATIVNLRFLIFSAALQPHFRHLPVLRRLTLSYCNVDNNFVLFMSRFGAEKRPEKRAGAGRAGRAGLAQGSFLLRHVRL